jgi:hypothetical protein
MTTSGLRLGLGDLFGAGGRALSRYTGTLFAVFIAQSLLAAGCLVAIFVVLAQVFSHLPMFDDAVDGDLVALIYCLKWGKPSFLAIAGIIFGGLVIWQLISWFLVGGLYGVLDTRPEGRRETARVFGASGAATYLAYARLALCALPGWIVVLFALFVGLGMVSPGLETALTVPQVVGPLFLAVLPAMLLAHYLWTVTEYARIELTLRSGTHDVGVIATYLRTLLWVARRPLTLLHSGFGWFVVFLVTLAYAYLAAGHPMYGTDGAITLFLVRLGVSLLRMAIRFGVLAGQVELGRTRPLPRQRPAPTVDKIA